MSRWQEARSVFWPLAAGLLLYTVALTALTGDIGFEGDDWWIFSWAYRNSLPSALLAYARASLRPIEGLYWVTLFEVFGFDKTVFNLCSLLLSAGGSLLMGLCLSRVFPRRPVFVAAAVLFAFFLPTVSSLTYVLATDNSRLSMLFFWACAAAFQRWAATSLSWPGLVRPVLLYALAFLTYEAPSFLMFTVPLLVWPVWARRPDVCSERNFLVQLAVGMIAGFGLAILARFLLFDGGAVAHRSLLPPWELVWGYIALLPFYLIAPFTSVSWTTWGWVFGIAVAIWSCWALFRAESAHYEPGTTNTSEFEPSTMYVLILGLAILFLGMLPYQLAGYGSTVPKLVDSVMVKWGVVENGNTPWFNFNWSSRIYSAGSFGIAILLAALVTAGKSRMLKLASKVAAVIILGFMAAFHTGLSTDWKEAAQIRNQLIASLISQVPDVKSGTNFLFLDLECCHKRAPVFRGWGGLKELIRILYDDPKLGAWYLYPYSWKWPDRVYHQAVVSPTGFVSRGMKLDNPVPHDSLLILGRTGSELAVLDGVNARDGQVPTGICWKRASEIRSNLGRVVAWSDTDLARRRLAKNVWNTGLISTLHLDRIKLSFRIVNPWRVALHAKRLKRPVLKK
jgi:hypothetical protein